jgi:hypothetical protein
MFGDLASDTEVLENGDNLIYFVIGSTEWARLAVREVVGALRIDALELVHCLDGSADVSTSIESFTGKCAEAPHRKLVIFEELGALSVKQLRQSLDFMKKVSDKGAVYSQMILLVHWEVAAFSNSTRLEQIMAAASSGVSRPALLNKRIVQSAWDEQDLLQGGPFNMDALLGRVARVVVELPPLSSSPPIPRDCSVLHLDQVSLPHTSASCSAHHFFSLSPPPALALTLAAAGLVLVWLMIRCFFGRPVKGNGSSSSHPKKAKFATSPSPPPSSAEKSLEQLLRLSRAELQGLAKAAGIRANQASGPIAQQLSTMDKHEGIDVGKRSRITRK